MGLPLELADLDGLVSEQVGLRLAELAGDVSRTEAIVEVGSFKGKSTCYLAAGAREGRGAHVWAVDAWDLPGNVGGRHRFADPTVHDIFVAQLRRLDLLDRVTALRGWSVDVAHRWEGAIGLLFIDASHEYEDVRGDFAAWRPFVSVGGALVFDDYRTAKNPGVTRVVDKLRADPEWDRWEFAPAPLAIARRIA